MKRFLSSFSVVICLVIAAGTSAALAYTPPSPPAPTKNLYEMIAANKNLGKFAGMIEEAGLKDTLSANTGEPMTVFAPTDDALGDIPGDVMKRIEASKGSLQSFVKYHIIAGSAVSSGSIRGRRIALASASGEELSFDGTDRAKPPKVGDASLGQADIATTNGVLHIVSGALVPPSLAQAPLPLPVVKKPQPPQAPTAAAAPAVPPPAQAATPTAPLRITTSGIVQSPVAPPATADLGPSATKITTTGVAAAPSAAGVTTSPTGFELFGHKFSW